MIDKKNLSPRQLSAFTALVLSIPISLGIFILQKNWKEGLIAFILIFSGSYLLILSIYSEFYLQEDQAHLQIH